MKMRDSHRILLLRCCSMLISLSHNFVYAAYDYDYSSVREYPHASLLNNNNSMLEAHLKGNGLFN